MAFGHSSLRRFEACTCMPTSEDLPPSPSQFRTAGESSIPRSRSWRKGSQVPHKSLNQVHAAFMPDADWTVSRLPPDLSRVNDYPPVLTSFLRFRQVIVRFAFARLLGPYLTESCPAFSSTLTTQAFDLRSLRWFEACTCMPASRGLPSSPVQHGCSSVLSS